MENRLIIKPSGEDNSCNQNMKYHKISEVDKLCPPRLLYYKQKISYFPIARTLRTIVLMRSRSSSGSARIWSHTCAMMASFALSTGCGSANSSASEMSSAWTIFSSVLIVGLLSPRSRCPRNAGLILPVKPAFPDSSRADCGNSGFVRLHFDCTIHIVTCPLILGYLDN